MIGILNFTAFSSCEGLACKEEKDGKRWNISENFLKLVQNLQTSLNLFGNSFILKQASNDFERLVEDDTFIHSKSGSKPKRCEVKAMCSAESPSPGAFLLLIT